MSASIPVVEARAESVSNAREYFIPCYRFGAAWCCLNPHEDRFAAEADLRRNPFTQDRERMRIVRVILPFEELP